jgi:ABC-type sugar transport system, permease component
MNRQAKKLVPRYVLLIFFSLIVLLPISGLFLGAFKTDTQLIQGPSACPRPGTWKISGRRGSQGALIFSSRTASSSQPLW